MPKEVEVRGEPLGVWGKRARVKWFKEKKMKDKKAMGKVRVILVEVEGFSACCRVLAVIEGGMWYLNSLGWGLHAWK